MWKLSEKVSHYSRKVIGITWNRALTLIFLHSSPTSLKNTKTNNPKKTGVVKFVYVKNRSEKLSFVVLWNCS